MTAHDRTRLTDHLERHHTPVMTTEVMEFIHPKRCSVIVDGTTGEGGHSRIFLENADCRVICFDADSDMLSMAKRNLSNFSSRVEFIHSNYSDIKNTLASIGINGVDGILLDLGISMAHIKGLKRGITFSDNQPLDMRLDTSKGFPASYYINSMTENEISDVLWKYGEERQSRRIAKAIVSTRRKVRIENTDKLVEIITKAYMGRSRINPATRSFQAFRILVNNELRHLEDAIPDCLECLMPGGTLVIISYHSLEDRIVKYSFKNANPEEYVILTKKPICPSDEERISNRASRSAKLRAIRRVDD